LGVDPHWGLLICRGDEFDDFLFTYAHGVFLVSLPYLTLPSVFFDDLSIFSIDPLCTFAAAPSDLIHDGFKPSWFQTEMVSNHNGFKMVPIPSDQEATEMKIIHWENN
jgi:hypothetical protein